MNTKERIDSLLSGDETPNKHRSNFEKKIDEYLESINSYALEEPQGVGENEECGKVCKHNKFDREEDSNGDIVCGICGKIMEHT